MAATRRVTLWCDAPRCRRRYESDAGTAGAARESAARWTFVDERDYCPVCSTDDD